MRTVKPTPALETLRGLNGIRRGWPGKEGSVTFEHYDARGNLRAGIVDRSGKVVLAPVARDEKLPSLAPGSGTLLVHRYNRRAVVHHGEAVTKHVRSGKAQAIARASTEIRAVCRPLDIGAAQVTQVTDASVTFSLLPGRSLHELGEDAAAGWEAFECLWPEFMAQRPAVDTFSAEDEATTLLAWVSKAKAFGAIARIDELERAATRVARDLQGPSDTPVLIHRDLHDKQMLWNGASLSVLDLDTAARGEAALDLGNLMAHVHLRQLQGHIASDTALKISSHLDTVARRAGVSPRRLSTYTASALLRLACVYSFRPSSCEWLEPWIEFALTRKH